MVRIKENGIKAKIKEFAAYSDKPVIAYPNGKDKYDLSFGTRDFSENARIWFENGAKLIGGCCLTTPNDIQKISAWARQILDRQQKLCS